MSSGSLHMHSSMLGQHMELFEIGNELNLAKLKDKEDLIAI